MTPLNTGYVLNNRYRIVKQIAQGGFGAIYRAWDLHLKRPCAVKENLETSQAAQLQFEHEALILSKLSHPHLAKVFDYFVISGQGQYLVMDFIEGQDLQEKLSLSGPLPLSQALAWISQVCDTLHYLHSQNPPIIHRDVKPANIKINSSGEAVLVDFGIAKEFHPSTKTTRGARAVTPGYSPPEQYGQGRTDARTDVYALGATLYALLTGQEPPESVLISTGQAPLPKVRSLNPAVSAAVETAIEGAMCSHPDGRYQTIRSFQAALHAARPTSPRVTGGKGNTAQTAALVPPARRPSLPWLMAAIGVMVGLLSLGMLFLRGVGSPPTPTATAQAAARSRGETVFPSRNPPGADLQTAEPSVTPRLPVDEASSTRVSVPTRTASPSPTTALTPTPPTDKPWGKIVWTCMQGGNEEDEQICLMNADGSGKRQLTSGRWSHRYASLSPDGNAVFYSSRASGRYEIHEINLNSGEEWPLTNGPGDSSGPEISPDGSSIVFARHVPSDKNWGIWIIGRNGSNPRLLFYQEGGDAVDATWSPDGGQILFAYGGEENKKLYLMGKNGDHPQLVSSSLVTRGRSDWSPAGDFLVGYSGLSWERTIQLLRVDGSDLHRVGNVLNSQGPSFSPDGRWIAFTGYKNHTLAGCEIYIMRLDGSETHPLTDNNLCDYQPRWGP